MPNSRNFEKYLEWLTKNQGLFGKNERVGKKAPLLPGKVLLEHYLQHRGISQLALAQKIGCTHAKVNEVIHGKRAITPAFALALEKALGTPAELWLSLQVRYDLWRERRKQSYP